MDFGRISRNIILLFLSFLHKQPQDMQRYFSVSFYIKCKIYSSVGLLILRLLYHKIIKNYVMILDKPGIATGGPLEAEPMGHMMQSYWNPSDTATKKKYKISLSTFRLTRLTFSSKVPACDPGGRIFYHNKQSNEEGPNINSEKEPPRILKGK